MSRYIDADKIEEVIRNDVPLKYFMASSYNVAIKNGLKIAEILNDKIPTADVVEVKHRQWSSFPAYKNTYTDMCYRCMECGCVDTDPTNFCPSCGARMDGGVKE